MAFKQTDRSCAAAAGKPFDFNVQLGWPYAILLVETVCVLLHARMPLALACVFLVLFQSPQDSQLLKTVAGLGIFPRYKDAKFFCQALTVYTIGSFLVVSYLMSRA
jgi:hypothetical protein